MTSLLALAKSMQPCLQPAMIDDIMRGDMRDILKHALMSLIACQSRTYPEPGNVLAAFSFYASLSDIRAVVLDYTPSAVSDGTAFSGSSVAVQTIANTLAAQKLAPPSTPSADLHALAKNGVLLLNMCLTADSSRTPHAFWLPYTTAILAKLHNVPVIALCDNAAGIAALRTLPYPTLLSPPPTLYQQDKHVVNPAFATTTVFAEAAQYRGCAHIWTPDSPSIADSTAATDPAPYTPPPPVSAPVPTCSGTGTGGEHAVDKVIVPAPDRHTGTLAVYITRVDSACRIVYRFATPTVVFSITECPALPDGDTATAALCADIASRISQYTVLSVSDLVDMLVSPATSLIGNFPHTLADTQFRIRVYSKIAGIGARLPYPCRRTSWCDARMRDKHAMLY